MTPSRPAAKRLRCRNGGNDIGILPVRSRTRHEKILDFISTDIMRDTNGSDSARVKPGGHILNGEAGTEGNDGVATRWCIRCGRGSSLFDIVVLPSDLHCSSLSEHSLDAAVHFLRLCPLT